MQSHGRRTRLTRLAPVVTLGLAVVAGSLPVLVGPAAQAVPTATPALRAVGPQADPDPGIEDPRGRVEARSERRLAQAAPAFPLNQTFTLHSRPGSNRTLFIDVDGIDRAGSEWELRGGAGGWDPAGNGAAFTDDELAAVQQVFLQVAEDYAPFDVDVTTQQPADAAITRSGSGDPVFGTTAVVTSTDSVHEAICEAQCGGVAFGGVFADAQDHADYQPAWVFSDGLADDPKAVAETVSHEVGHTLGLDHDGRGDEEYFDGGDLWAPIMGASFYSPVSQWSRGEYAGATRTEDDLAILAAGGVPLRADDVGDTPAAASALPTGGAAGVIGTRADRDVFSLGTCTGQVTLAATPAAVGPNLDVGLRLLDAAGQPVATADPPARRVSAYVASGLNASITTTLATGAYFVEVDGVGAGSAASAGLGYSDYASLGGYSLTRTGSCGSGAASAPAAPASVAATGGTDAVTVTWTPPADDGGSAVTGYRVALGGTVVELVATARRHVFEGLPAGTHTVSVRAVNAVGAGPEVTRSATVSDQPAVTAPGVPVLVSTRRDVAARTIEVGFDVPADDGGSPIAAIEARFDGGEWTAFDADTTGLQVTEASTAAYRIEIRAVNAVGAGQALVVDVPAARAPSAPKVTSAMPGKAGGQRTVKVAWTLPTAGDAPVNGYRVRAVRVAGGPRATFQSAALTRRSVELVLPAGTYVLSVQARNAVGWGAYSAASGRVAAR